MAEPLNQDGRTALRQRSFILAGPALLLALAAFLLASGMLAQRWWVLPLAALGLLMSYWLPRRFRFNTGLFVMVITFIIAGVRIAALREEMDAAVLLPAYQWIAVLMVLLSSFKVFTRLDIFLMLGCGVLLCVGSCALAPNPFSFSASALFLLLALPALWPLLNLRARGKALLPADGPAK